MKNTTAVDTWIDRRNAHDAAGCAALYAEDASLDGHVVLEWQDKVGLLGVNIYEIADGLVQRQRNYFDPLSFIRLNGLPLARE